MNLVPPTCKSPTRWKLSTPAVCFRTSTGRNGLYVPRWLQCTNASPIQPWNFRMNFDLTSNCIQHSRKHPVISCDNMFQGIFRNFSAPFQTGLRRWREPPVPKRGDDRTLLLRLSFNSSTLLDHNIYLNHGGGHSAWTEAGQMFIFLTCPTAQHPPFLELARDLAFKRKGRAKFQYVSTPNR